MAERYLQLNHLLIYSGQEPIRRGFLCGGVVPPLEVLPNLAVAQINCVTPRVVEFKLLSYRVVASHDIGVVSNNLLVWIEESFLAVPRVRVEHNHFVRIVGIDDIIDGNVARTRL